MKHRTVAECDALIAGIEESICAIRDPREPVAIAHEAGVSSPTAVRIPDTKKKNLPDSAACWSDIERGTPSGQHKSMKSPDAENVRQSRNVVLTCTKDNVAFEDEACSWLSTSAPSARPKRHTVMNSKWARGSHV
ncbi:hypothetical protein T484DRAFT_1750654 [Baffinella frigidus]|nr:hypothetical protein T484DRAFT_1750654 [Cryptophyta sp. CCMP2293]